MLRKRYKMGKEEKKLCNRSKVFENEQICRDLNSVMDYIHLS